MQEAQRRWPMKQREGKKVDVSVPKCKDSCFFFFSLIIDKFIIKKLRFFKRLHWLYKTER